MHHHRKLWLDTMIRIADPVLHHLSHRTFKQSFPVEAEDRRAFAHLEALGRLLSGMAPWLETGPDTGEEGRLRSEYAELARSAIDAGTDPDSPDHMNFSSGDQPIVDASFLALAILRAPNELWAKLDPHVKKNVIAGLKETRTRKPVFSNWLLFSALIETALHEMQEDWDPMRIDYALRQHEQWYLGDSVYGDGPEHHFDYYNSFVIHPFLVEIVERMHGYDPFWDSMKDRVTARAARYATIQERLISPEGTFPPIGRSLAYRFGAFHLLAQAAYKQFLDASLSPAQVQSALTAVIQRTISVPGMFDDNGWLRVGFCGYQPEIGESYISTGSLYLCAAVFLPLGLKEDDPFWQGEADWTARKMWSGQPGDIDRAYTEK